MVIQFDVDGVLADFMTAFTRLAKAHGYTDRVVSCREQATYSDYGGMPGKAVTAVWNLVKADRGFWMGCPALVEAHTFRRIEDLQARHEIYFVTARVGPNARVQTMTWLEWKGVRNPAVVVTPHKWPIAMGLGTAFSIEDKIANAVSLAPYCESYLIDRPYNQTGAEHIRRVKTVDVFLDAVESYD